ncbi:hypothetical protein K439DRAFT_1634691 [Ramaria rubella]|nr:hypothetical protein K439DRAFT_1634691 [Ramaria rubella]
MSLPTTTISGISVPDTPLVRSAISYAKSESPAWLFHHVMRSWLFAVKLAETEKATLDEETLAVATILHDLGLVPEHVSPERRFEVDGAISAVSFLKAQHGNGGDLHSIEPAEHFKQKLRELTVWDAVAMHTTPSLAHYTVPEVAYCQRGIAVDFVGRGLELLPDAAATFGAILAEYPHLEMKDGFRECLCTLARNKPQTTYDNFVGAIGQAYVKGYERSTEEEEMLVAAIRPIQ